MRMNCIAATMLLVGFVGTSHAEAMYSAGFQVVQSIPIGPAPDSPVRSNGDRAGSAMIAVRDQVGSVFDAPTGTYVPLWSQEHVDEHFEYAWFPRWDPRLPSPYRAAWGAAATGYPFYGTSGATAHIEESGGQVRASTVWRRGFVLDPYSSFTFSGIAHLNITGDDEPLDLATSHLIEPALGFAALSVYDAAERVRTIMGVTISNAIGGLDDLFSYSIGAGGLLSITVTNSTGEMLTGAVRAANYVNASVVAQVPEPRTHLLMALGLAALALAVPRRARPALKP